jgi:hypothetical protein
MAPWTDFGIAETGMRRDAYTVMRLHEASFPEDHPFKETETIMRRAFFAFAVVPFLVTSAAIAGDAEIKAGQSVIDGQLQALIANDGNKAYSFAAPNVKRIFPTVDAFMNMVTNGYPPVRKPRSYAFGKVEETAPGSIVQQVLIVGPDGKDYEAVYTLQQQPDGTFQITGCSLRASNSLST